MNTWFKVSTAVLLIATAIVIVEQSVSGWEPFGIALAVIGGAISFFSILWGCLHGRKA